MNDKKNYKKGHRAKLLYLALELGIIPTKLVPLLPTNTMSMQRTLRRIIHEENCFEKYHDKNIWGIIIDPQMSKRLREQSEHDEEIRELQNEYPDLIQNYLNTTIKDVYKLKLSKNSIKDHTNAMRIQRNAKATFFMYTCDIPCFPDQPDKINLPQKEPGRLLSYFTSKEIKVNTEMEDYITENKEQNLRTVNGTRINGIVSLESGTYTVIYTDNKLYNYSYMGERRTEIFTRSISLENHLEECGGCILLYEKDSIIERMVQPTSANDSQYSNNLINAYNEKCVYAIPVSKEGQQMIKIFRYKNFAERLKHLSLPEEYIEKNNMVIDCDGYGKDAYHFVFFTPDIARLKKFIKNAEININEKFYIYCFVHQKPLIESMIRSHNIKIRSLPVEAVVENLRTGYWTRITGIVSLESGNYTVIYTDNKLYNYSFLGKKRTKEFTKSLSLENHLETRSISLENHLEECGGCILLYEKDSIIERMVQPTGADDSQYSINLINAYSEKCVYAIPVSKEGQQMIKIFRYKNFAERLKHLSLPEAYIEKNNMVIDCDGYGEDAYHFVFCAPDIARLKKFIKNAEINIDEKFYIYCFVHQKPLIERMIRSHNIKIRSVPVEAVIEAFEKGE